MRHRTGWPYPGQWRVTAVDFRREERVTDFEREIREQPEVLRRLLDASQPAEVGRALRRNAPRVVLTIARGSSDNAVTFFAYLVGLTLGVPVASVPPSLVTLHETPFQADGSLVVGVSQSGESQDVVAAVERLVQRGAQSVAVHNAPGSSLERVCDLAIDMKAGEERSVAASKTFISQMMGLARMVAEWADDATLRNDLASVPAVVEALLNDTTSIDRAAARWTHADQVDVLGRGLSYSAALETALKLKETAYLHAHAYSSAEFQHGPIASLGVGDPLLLFGAGGPTLPATRDAADRIHQVDADLTVVSSHRSLLDRADAAIPLPSDLEPVAEAFAFVVVGQLLALRLAEERSLDPDAPRHLRKVTQTR